MFAQIPSTTASSLGSWLTDLAAVVLMAYYVTRLVFMFVRKPPVDATFVSKHDCRECHRGAAEATDRLRAELRDLDVGIRSELRSLSTKFEEGLASFNLANERRVSDLHTRINGISDRVSKLEGRTLK